MESSLPDLADVTATLPIPKHPSQTCMTPKTDTPIHEPIDSNQREAKSARSTKPCSNGHQSHDALRHLIQLSSTAKPLRAPPRRMSDLMYVERYENGGGYALHSYADELAHLSKDELDLFARKFFRSLFTERRKRGAHVPFSYYCIGVVHGAARRFPELLSYLRERHPNMPVNTNPLEHKNATEAITMSEYARNVFQTYTRGIFRFGPLHSISMVGVKGEERGCLSDEMIKLIEADPFLRLVTPWGKLSQLCGTNPNESNDGPIIWARHGEQSVPVCPSLPNSRKRMAQGSDLVDLLVHRRTRRDRQILVPDRTPCHADHADDGLGRHTTAAIGLLKAIYPPPSSGSQGLPRSPTSTSTTESNIKMASPETDTSSASSVVHPYATTSHAPGRIIKDVVVFDPRHYVELVKRLRLDIMEPPASQCGTFWADDGELNELHAEGFLYVRLPLRDNDIYFIPRNVVHQFKTVSAAVSIAWHVRLRQYYEDRGTPNNANGLSTSSVTTATTTTSASTPPLSSELTAFDAGSCKRKADPIDVNEEKHVPLLKLIPPPTPSPPTTTITPDWSSPEPPLLTTSVSSIGPSSNGIHTSEAAV